jgi:AcrR family transcriptional regulator
VTKERTNAETALLQAAEKCLLRHGLAGLSTRRVADEAGMPLSQIHYHLGSKRGLLLALLEFQNDKLLTRQEAMYAQPQPLWKRWNQACAYLEEDLASGYVRVLQEMIAAGWSDARIGKQMRKTLKGWFDLLTRVAAEAAEQLGGLGGFAAAEVASLVGNVFLGAEAMVLLGFSETELPSRAALRKIGDVLRDLESRPEGGGRRHARNRTGS